MDKDSTRVGAAVPRGAAKGQRPLMDRRRFAKGVTPVVLGSLVSKPVLGAQYICTVSGHTSGNASAHLIQGVNCSVGMPPAHWALESTAWPAGFVKGTLPVISGTVCSFPAPGIGTLFNGYTTAGGRVLADQFWTRNAANGCLVRTTPNNRPSSSMLEVLSSTIPDPDLTLRLGKATIASLLSAAGSMVNYPVSPDRIVDMFNAVRSGGSYLVPGANLSLTKLGVIEYLEKLYAPAP